MDGIALIGLLIYTGGAFAYGMTLTFWVREIGRVAWPIRAARASRALTESDVVNGALLLVSFAWFCVNAVVMFLQLGPRVHLWSLDVATVMLAFSFPPLIMHTAWAEVSAARSARGSTSRALLWPAYVVAMGIPIFSLVMFLRFPSSPSARAAGVLLGYSLPILFVCAAVYSMMIIGRQPVERRARARQERRWLLGLFALMGLLFIVLLVAGIQSGGSRGRPIATALLFELEIAAKSLPLLFIFVGAYFENRFDFLDLFVKRGLALLASTAVMAAGFAVMLPILRSAADRWFAPWMYAIAMLPVIAALPWIHGRIAKVLDQRWLGRRFTTVEAIKRFLTGLKSAANEAQLIELAQVGLGEIFDAPCLVKLHAERQGDAAAFTVEHELPIRSGNTELGRIVMGPRASDARYFRDDIELLTSLADVLGSVLVNLRLQEARKEQEQRSHELSLHASRSELKALRAQINPHFLFNALNAIAGLIHRNPRAADRTIEQLADVFRYALGGAESEWAALGDEVEFVKAYLEVERARFGDRLHADVSIAEDVRAARVPTMAVQTLVENAVKHGLSELRGPALVRIDARRDGDTLVVSVIDNGPGFTSAALSATHRASGPRGGYGLTNIRQRLNGYFGDGGALTIDRDSARAETVVSLKLPLVFDAATDRTRGVSEASDVLAPQPESGR